MSQPRQQLTLNVQLRDDATLDNYLCTDAARALLKALEGKENLVRLVNECIQSPGDPLQVVIGLPGRPSLLKSFALIGTSYCLEGKVTGRLAILGPVRMHYERVIRAVGYIGRLFQSQELN